MVEPFRLALEAIPEHSFLCYPRSLVTDSCAAEGEQRGKKCWQDCRGCKPQGMWECSMSRTCGLERVALEPRPFAKSIGIRKAEQGGEEAAGREQSLGKGESETFLLVCHWSQSKGL